MSIKRECQKKVRSRMADHDLFPLDMHDGLVCEDEEEEVPCEEDLVKLIIYKSLR